MMNRMMNKKWLTLTLASSLFAAALAGCSQSGNAQTSGGTATASATTSAAATDTASASAAPTADATDSGASSASASASTQTASAEPSSAPTAQASSDPQTVSLGTPSALRMASFKSGWAGGAGWIARTDDSGKTWQTQYTSKHAVVQIFALNEQKAWATLDIGDSKSLQLVKTTNGGKSWSDAGKVPSHAFLHFVSDTEAFSGGWTTRDGGAKWTQLSVPKDTVGEVYYHDRSNGWAVTQTAGKKFTFLRTTDGGKNWKPVYSRALEGPINGAVIRSAGKNDAWIELIGDSGMTQTSYSLFHTSDGGKSWLPVVANNTAGAGPAPGFKMDDKNLHSNTGSSPGTLYVVDTKTAFLGGQCQACDNPNTLGHTTDGGKTWVNAKPELPGYGTQLIAAADAKQVWWILTGNEQPAVMYTSQDSGTHWTKTHAFAKPKQQS